MNGPCLDCPDRVIGCHGSCEKYIAFKERKLQETNNMIHQNEFKYRTKFNQRKYNKGRYYKWNR